MSVFFRLLLILHCDNIVDQAKKSQSFQDFGNSSFCPTGIKPKPTLLQLRNLKIGPLTNFYEVHKR